MRKLLSKKKEFKKFFKTKLERARSLWPEFVCYEGLGEIEKFISKTLKKELVCLREFSINLLELLVEVRKIDCLQND